MQTTSANRFFLFIMILVLLVPFFYGFSFSPNNLQNAYSGVKKIKLPIIMYHSVLQSKKGVYIVSPEALKNDIVTLKKYGYQFVLPSEVIAFAYNLSELPNKPIMITFDDGHYNFLHYALPVVAKYQAKAVVNVIGSFSQFSDSSGDSANANYSHLTWQEISKIVASKSVEIGNHTYAMHKYSPRFGISKLPTETEEQYKKNVFNDLSRLQNILHDKCRIKPQVFAYPFGKYTKQTEGILTDLGIKMSFTCNEGVSVISNDIGSLRLLKRINRNGGFSSYQLVSKIEKYCK